MIKKLRIALSLIFAASLIIMVVLTSNQRDYLDPADFSSYTNVGYYQIAPDSILGNIDLGAINVFNPLLGDPDQIEDLHNTISWSQSDFLKVVNALNQFKWNKSLDLENWKVYYIYFETGCMNDFHGFRVFDIVYYKYQGIKDWARIYNSRIVRISLWNGVLSWGDGKFSTPLLSNLDQVELKKFSITADHAIQIAEEHGGRNARLSKENNCVISINVPFSNFNESWNVDYYYGIGFNIIVNPYSGKYKILH